MPEKIPFFFGNNDFLSFLLIILFLYFYPRIYLWQVVSKLETELVRLEEYSKEAQKEVARKMKSAHKGERENMRLIRKKVSEFMDFFVVSPVSTDPYGILKKIEHVIKISENRIERFVERVTGTTSRDEKKNIKYGLIGAMGVTMIYKVVRHYVEMIKKTNNLQLAMVLQMILPEILKAAKANVKATKAFLEGIPIGDGVGPLVAAKLKSKAGREIERDVVVSTERIGRKRVFVMKAKGKGAEISQTRMWHAIEKLIKKERVRHIISIDASVKLEGEKTGSVAEGVGFVMSPQGVDRAFVEELATKQRIELDGVVIKMSDYEASIPMKKEIYDAVPLAVEKVRELVELSPHDKILIVGVGNTCGIGNSAKEVENIEKVLRPVWRKLKREEEEEKRRKWPLFPA